VDDEWIISFVAPPCALKKNKPRTPMNKEQMGNIHFLIFSCTITLQPDFQNQSSWVHHAIIIHSPIKYQISKIMAMVVGCATME
jgi:hypothetical protein